MHELDGLLGHLPTDIIRCGADHGSNLAELFQMNVQAPDGDHGKDQIADQQCAKDRKQDAAEHEGNMMNQCGNAGVNDFENQQAGKTPSQ